MNDISNERPNHQNFEINEDKNDMKNDENYNVKNNQDNQIYQPKEFESNERNDDKCLNKQESYSADIKDKERVKEDLKINSVNNEYNSIYSDIDFIKNKINDIESRLSKTFKLLF